VIAHGVTRVDAIQKLIFALENTVWFFILFLSFFKSTQAQTQHKTQTKNKSKQKHITQTQIQHKHKSNTNINTNNRDLNL
jgi:hypothetical protein